MSYTYGFRGSLSVDHHRKHFEHLQLIFFYRNYPFDMKECGHCFSKSHPLIFLRSRNNNDGGDMHWIGCLFQKQVRTGNGYSFLRVLWRSANHRRLLRCLSQPVKPNERENWSGVHNGQISSAAVS